MIIMIFWGVVSQIFRGFSVNPDQDFGGFVKLYIHVFSIFLCNYLSVSIQLVGFPRDQCGSMWGRGGPWYLWGICDRVGCYGFPFFKLLVWDYAQ